ncbi:MAG: tyrosine-type recombinase/integrase, partial [Gammaproteobacteria bacterium]
LLTGLRRNEVLNAKWSDVDLKQRTFFIGQTKNGEALLTPLSRAAVARLKSIARIDGNPYIICGSVSGRPLVNLRSAWKRVRDAAGLQDVDLHPKLTHVA